MSVKLDTLSPLARPLSNSSLCCASCARTASCADSSPASIRVSGHAVGARLSTESGSSVPSTTTVPKSSMPLEGLLTVPPRTMEALALRGSSGGCARLRLMRTRAAGHVRVPAK